MSTAKVSLKKRMCVCVREREKERERGREREVESTYLMLLRQRPADDVRTFLM